jgi:hypothetical protein
MSNFRLASFLVFSSCAQIIGLSNLGIVPVLDDIFQDGCEEQEMGQHFIWAPGAINFFSYGSSGSYWTEVFIGSRVQIDKKSFFAVSLPFTVSADDAIQFGGTDDIDEIQTVRIARGKYRLIYQERYLTRAEIKAIPIGLPPFDPEPDIWINLGSKYCKFTFIPTSDDVIAEILKIPPGDHIPLPLLLRN